MKLVGYDKKRCHFIFKDMDDEDVKILELLGLEKSYSLVDEASDTEYISWTKKKESPYATIKATTPGRWLDGVEITPKSIYEKYEIESHKGDIYTLIEKQDKEQ